MKYISEINVVFLDVILDTIKSEIVWYYID